MPTIKQTQLIAKLAHGRRRDKLGKPYICHLKRVAERLKWFPIEYRHTALLYSTLEFTTISPKWLIDFGYSKAVVEACMLLAYNLRPDNLSHRKWLQYILSTENELAITVMYAALQDDSCPAVLEYNGKGSTKQEQDAIKLFDYVAKYKDKHKSLRNVTQGDL